MLRVPIRIHSYHSNAFVDSHRIRMIVSSVEHESILETARDLEKDGIEVIYLSVSKEGVVDLEALKSVLCATPVRWWRKHHKSFDQRFSSLYDPW